LTALLLEKVASRSCNVLLREPAKITWKKALEASDMGRSAELQAKEKEKVKESWLIAPIGP
jgi:hypothetical protein